MHSLITTFITLSSVLSNHDLFELEPNQHYLRDIRSFNEGGDLTDLIILAVENNKRLCRLSCNQCFRMTIRICHKISYLACQWPLEVMRVESNLYDEFVPIHESTSKLFDYFTGARNNKPKLLPILPEDASSEMEKNEDTTFPPIVTPNTILDSSLLQYLPHKICLNATCRVSHRLSCLVCVPMDRLFYSFQEGVGKKMIFWLIEYFDDMDNELVQIGNITNKNMKKDPNIFSLYNSNKLNKAEKIIKDYLKLAILLDKYPHNESTCGNKGKNCAWCLSKSDRSIHNNDKSPCSVAPPEKILTLSSLIDAKFRFMVINARKLALKEAAEDFPNLYNNISYLQKNIDEYKKKVSKIKIYLQTTNGKSVKESSASNPPLNIPRSRLDSLHNTIKENNEQIQSTQVLLNIIYSLLDDLSEIKHSFEVCKYKYICPTTIISLLQNFLKDPISQIYNYHLLFKEHLDEMENLLKTYYELHDIV